MKFQFVEEKDKEKNGARIKVIGVGGAGGNAINNMDCSQAERRGIHYGKHGYSST